MKKVLMIILALVLTGCTSEKKVVRNADLDEYQSYYEDLYEETSFDTDNPYFTTSLELARADKGTYTYAVVIDNPQTAMYDIRALVLEDDLPYDSTDKMMPSSGIMDTAYSLVPGQVNKKDGYAKGIALRGSVDESSVEIRLLVEWRNENNETRRICQRWNLNEQGAQRG